MLVRGIEQIEFWLKGSALSPFWFPYVKLLILLAALSLICALAWWLGRALLKTIVHRFVTSTKATWDDILFERRFFRSLAHIIPALILEIAAPSVFSDFPNWIPMVTSFAKVAIVAMVLISVNSLFNAIADILQEVAYLKDKPIRSYTQLTKIIFFIIGFILIIAILIGRSPIYILGGFGAATAVLVLLFKDAILGFAASVQMSVADLVRMGDWITVEKYNSDGEVIEINLTSVKVKNWDMTVSIIPSYALIQDSFKNWRGMQVSGGRRIKRHIHVKISSIRFVDESLYQRLLQVELIRPYLEQRQGEINDYNAKNKVDKSQLINGRQMTNIGVFRVYAEAYLAANPDINTEMTFMVRHLQSSDSGLPLEIYGFTYQKKWEQYEKVMADIFDHLLAAIKAFDLEVFEAPTGSDYQAGGPAA
jgi:miniconductance mechanosensitive channel